MHNHHTKFIDEENKKFFFLVKWMCSNIVVFFCCSLRDKFIVLCVFLSPVKFIIYCVIAFEASWIFFSTFSSWSSYIFLLFVYCLLNWYDTNICLIFFHCSKFHSRGSCIAESVQVRHVNIKFLCCHWEVFFEDDPDQITPITLTKTRKLRNIDQITLTQIIAWKITSLWNANTKLTIHIAHSKAMFDHLCWMN